MAIEVLSIIVRGGLVLATAILFIIVFSAYIRLRNSKLMFISAGFGVFFVHALLTLPELFSAYTIDENTHLTIHLIGLAVILFGTLKD